jgi:hypothetical protein
MFQEAFSATNITSVVNLKMREFFNFRQGHRTVVEYIDEFNKAIPYAPDDMNMQQGRRD